MRRILKDTFLSNSKKSNRLSLASDMSKDNEDTSESKVESGDAPTEEVQEAQDAGDKKDGEDTEKDGKDPDAEKTEKGEDKADGKGEPPSPSQVPPHMQYGNQGYMPVYGHPVYSHYGYPPHYPQPPYYPGGYAQYPPHMMPPPHMMSQGQYGHASPEQGGSPGRRYHSMPPYHPYPPASPVLSPNSTGVAANASPRGAAGARPEDSHDGVGEISSEDAAAAASRIKVYVKSSGQASDEVLARRSRKNAQSRSRAAKHREYIAQIENKPEAERTLEEQQVFQTHQMRRKRKNDRSRERALEKKMEIDRILAKPENKRSRIELQFLDSALGAKRRKNEGDRLRRHRLKELGLSPKGSGGKPGIPARGPLPVKYQELARSKQIEQAPLGYGMPPPGYGPPGMMPPPPHYQEAPSEGPTSPEAYQI